ncbi:MAG: 50S ribosomal protein L11 methyltransferase [Alphaproteobacteria bacterium]|nr:50S ribosomal protein L11 methyltransferase [Alphaproteobacteria bacterium]
MRLRQNLWLLNFSLPAEAAEFFGDVLGEGAVAVSVMAPPRKALAQVEAIYNFEPDNGETAMRLALLAAACGVGAPAFTIRPSPDLDWLKKVAADFPPLRIARWTVHGALHRGKVQNRLRALQIDATNAFGTGEHPTTRGCLLMLDRVLTSGFRPRRMADIGCGSGILAMACVQATRCRAVGVDLDPDSAQIAAGNARVNGLGWKMRVGAGRGYAAALVRREAPYDLIMANIFARPLCRMAADSKRNLRPGGIAILSGLLTSQANMVIAAHRMQSLALIGHEKIGEWSVLALRRSHRAG